MTATDFADFAEGLRQLAASYRGRDLKTTEIDAYWSSLGAYPLAFLKAGMQAAAILHPRFMPSVGELVVAARQAEAEQTRTRYVTPAMHEAIANGERHCLECEDTGWTVVERDCTAASPHYKTPATRRYARVCRCRHTNPIYQAKQAREARVTTEGGA